MPTGIELIAKEGDRVRAMQADLIAQGYKVDGTELVNMAITYAWPYKDFRTGGPIDVRIDKFFLFPYHKSFYVNRHYINSLAIAGALIAAEIDRLQSQSNKQ